MPNNTETNIAILLRPHLAPVRYYAYVPFVLDGHSHWQSFLREAVVVSVPSMGGLHLLLPGAPEVSV